MVKEWTFAKLTHDKHMLGNLGAQNLSVLNATESSNTKLMRKMASGVEFRKSLLVKPRGFEPPT